MIESVLGSIKKMLGIDKNERNFDDELIIHINGALMVMTQLGVGPSEGYSITSGANIWAELLGDRTDLNAVFTDVYLRVRLIFDPPANSFLVASIDKQIAEYDWRIEAWHAPQSEV